MMTAALCITALCFFAPVWHHNAHVNAAAAFAAQNETVLIIDAGHGGADGGAVSLTGIEESEINLDIALKLDQIMGFYGVRAIMTRETEELDYSEKAHTIREKKVEDQNRRLQLINGTERAVLISIHQNIFPDGSPFGAQVLYATTAGSKEFSEYMQKSLIGALNPSNRRAASRVPKSVMLFSHINCPAILIECGFLSNVEEERLLKTENYRLKIASVIAAGYLVNQNTLSNFYTGGTNES
jgi:N-acetylmuramoyl-L-alanine amidase